MRRRKLAAGLLFAAFGAPRAAQARLLGEVPISVVHDVPTVALSANGRPVTMILDTGAELTTLTKAAAARIGAEAPRIELDHRLAGIGAAIGTRQVELRTFAAGAASLPWRRLLVADVTIAQASALPLDGLLGADVLSDFDVEIDFSRHRLGLHERQSGPDAAPDWPGPYATIAAPRSAAGHLFFPVLLNGRGLAAIIDTGAQLSFVAASAARAGGVTDAALSRDRTMTAAGAAGEHLAAHLHRFSRLEVGGEILRDPELLVAEIALRDADVVLGADFLRTRRLWLSYGAQKVFLAPA